MRKHLYGILRPIAVVLLVLVVAACTSSGGTTRPASGAPLSPSGVSADPSGLATQIVAGATQSAMQTATHTATYNATLAPGVASGPSSAPPSGGTSVCPASATSGHEQYTLGGFEAWHMCGPATATVKLGGTTAHISSGSCTVPAPGVYDVAIGTQLFGDPPAALEPDFLNIYIVSVDGKTDPGGVVDHKDWLLIGVSIAFGPGKMSGTFSGNTYQGTAVKGSFTCS
jgi:hypothetical protein